MSLRTHLQKLAIGIYTAALLVATSTYAKSGCCSHHGGVAVCNSLTGFYRCSDGTDSPSCTCGYSTQNNFSNSSNDSSSTLTIYKCIDKKGVVHFGDQQYGLDCTTGIKP